MAISLHTATGQEARNQILSTLAACGDPMATSQLYPHVTVIKSINDLSTIIKLMIDAGDITRSPEKVKLDGLSKWTYRLAGKPPLSDEERKRLETVLSDELQPDPSPMLKAVRRVAEAIVQDRNSESLPDPVCEAIDQLPMLRVADGRARAMRLRHLADRYADYAPVLANDLYETAAILEDLAA